MSSDVAIRLQNVTKVYSSGRMAGAGFKNLVLHLPSYIRAWRKQTPFVALDDVSLEVRRGECFGIIGRNGCGKSTTLELIAGVLKPTTGSVETFGHICPLLELGAGFHHELSGRENIILNGILLGLTREEVLTRLDDIIAFSELSEFIDRPIRVYSSGMVARLGFSVAVHLRPEILLVDEVLAVGDESFQRKCLEKMESFRRAGVTTVLVTHNLEDVKRVCNRAALIEAGRVVCVGEPASVVDLYKSRSQVHLAQTA